MYTSIKIKIQAISKKKRQELTQQQNGVLINGQTVAIVDDLIDLNIHSHEQIEQLVQRQLNGKSILQHTQHEQ
jgi:adenine/guanine phosphoribosyltransferase-like PRPP-binding protein